MTDAARTALAEGSWDEARNLFEAKLAERETAEAHDGLSRSLWWLGLPDEAIVHRERAFVLYKQRGDTTAAAHEAIWLAREHLAVYGNDAVANGWLARAERLLGDASVPGRGWLAIARGRRSGEPLERERSAEVALAIAQEERDADLEVAALAELGLAALERGDAPRGLDRLDEAMAAATGGEVDMLETLAEACCSLVSACELAGDAGRLEQWSRIVASFVERRSDVALLNFCRTCNAEMLAAAGRREEAEVELRASAEQLRLAGHRSRCVDPSVKLAEVRLLQGRIEEATALLDGREDLPESTIPAADLDIARGDPALATARLLRRVNLLGRDNLLSAAHLGRLVEAQLAAGDEAGAAASAEDLATTASDSGHPLVVAHARAAAGRLAPDPREAATSFEVAIDRFAKLDLPLDAARAQLAAANALARIDPARARAHATAARTSFEHAGATSLADRAAALERQLGGPARTGPKDAGVLTRREREVLLLLGEGLSNAEIAARLFISTKTAGHHVGAVLAKLHLRNRQEAAAFAIRHADDV